MNLKRFLIGGHRHPKSSARLYTWRSLATLLFGFYAGLPAALTAGTLQAWFTEMGLDLRLIGGVTLLVLPYMLRFLWTPLFDEIRLPFLDRRRSWLFVIQCGLAVSVLAMAFLSPRQRFGIIPWLVVPGFFASLFAASQEIVINAWQTEVFAGEDRGFSAGVYVAGWRLGSVVSGGIALVLAARLGWQPMYLIMAALMATAPLITLIAPGVRQEKLPSRRRLGPVLYTAVREFFQRMGLKMALVLIALILTFKLGDALTLALNSVFLLRDLGFSLETVGLINKVVSIFSALAGGMVGGLWMRHLSLYRTLILFAVIQAFSHTGYILLAVFGKNTALLVIAAFLENFCSGMGTVALLALIMDLCRLEYTATQLSLFSALAYVPRAPVGPVAVWLVVHVGWVRFFLICVAASLLPVVFIRAAKRRLVKW